MSPGFPVAVARWRGRRSLSCAVALLFGAAAGFAVPALRAALAPLAAAPALPLACLLAAPVFTAALSLNLVATHRAFRIGRIFMLSLVVDWLFAPAILVAASLLLLREPVEAFAGLALLACARGFQRGTVAHEEIDGEREFAAGLAAFRAVFLALFAPVFVYVLAVALPEAIAEAPPPSLARVLLVTMVAVQLPVAVALFVRRPLRGVPPPEREPGTGEPFDRAAGLPTVLGVFCVGLLQAGAPGAAALLPLAALALVLHAAVVYLAAFFLAIDFNADFERAGPLALDGATLDGALALALVAGLFGLGHPAALACVAALLLEDPLAALAVRFAPRFRRRYGLPR